MAKRIHIYLSTRDAGEFKESEHPRGEGGKFGSGSGSSSSEQNSKMSNYLSRNWRSNKPNFVKWAAKNGIPTKEAEVQWNKFNRLPENSKETEIA